MGGGCVRPLVGCLVVALGLMVVVSLIPLLIAFAVLAATVLLVPAVLFGVWRTPWSLQTKRAITGFLLYPAGVYFLLRYTRLTSGMKAGAVGVAAFATLLIAGVHAFAPAMVLMLGVAFLALFFAAGTSDAGATVERPPSRGNEHIPEADLRRLLEIEQAQSGAERRLLLAREFSRVAEGALAASPTSLETWPDPRRLATLRAEARFLVASATDPTAAALPESPVDNSISAAELTTSIRALDAYLRRLDAIPRSEASLETMRVLARDRGQVQAACDRVVQSLTGPSRSTPSAPLPSPELPRVNPLPNPSRAKS
jgi:hypothetical protein